MAHGQNKVIHFPTATKLYQQQELHPWIYKIQSGFVIIYATNADGKEGLMDLYGAGSWFGPGLNNGTAIQSAKTRANCTLQRYDITAFHHHLIENKQSSLQLLQQFSQREKQLQQRLFLLQTAKLPERLAALLNYLFESQGQKCQHGHDKDIKLSQQELAAMIGASRQSVSQLLSEWKHGGIIDYTRGYLCLENVKKLESMCVT